MELLNHERFIAGNQELRDILRRAEGLESVDGRVTQEDLKSIGERLLNPTLELGEASRSETLDVYLLDEVAEYVKNLRTLQQVIESVRCAPADRRVPAEAAKSQIDSLESWLDACLQTA